MNPKIGRGVNLEYSELSQILKKWAFEIHVIDYKPANKMDKETAHLPDCLFAGLLNFLNKPLFLRLGDRLKQKLDF